MQPVNDSSLAVTGTVSGPLGGSSLIIATILDISGNGSVLGLLTKCNKCITSSRLLINLRVLGSESECNPLDAMPADDFLTWAVGFSFDA